MGEMGRREKWDNSDKPLTLTPNPKKPRRHMSPAVDVKIPSSVLASLDGQE